MALVKYVNLRTREGPNFGDLVRTYFMLRVKRIFGYLNQIMRLLLAEPLGKNLKSL